MRQIKKIDVNVIIEDLNATVGKGRDSDIIGDFELEERNERGDRFVQFCRG